MKKKFLILNLLFCASMIFAQEANVDDILQPVNNMYDLIKAGASLLGIIAITIAGAYYMFSGSNIQARENAKSMVSYSIVGLVLVWVAPLVVSFLTAPGP